MITKSQQSAMNLYAGMMEEVKMRISSIEFATSGLLNYHPVIIREISYLQLRLICELIALGCLVSHGDIPATRSSMFRKTWAADEILKALEQLHPDFYPHPCEQVAHSTHFELREIEQGFLTKRDLLHLYGKSGDFLHRGNLKKLLTGPLSAPQRHSDVQEWVAKIKTLLNLHRIALVGGESHFVCVLRNSWDGERVQVAFAEAQIPPTDVLRSAGGLGPAK